MVDVERLRRKTLFEGLTDGQLGAVGAHVKERQYAAGDVVIRAGEPGDRVYVLERGRVLVDDDASRPITVLARGAETEGIGDFFGELCLFDLEPRCATVTAIEATLVLEVGRESLFDIFARDTELRVTIALNIARVLARRLRALDRGARAAPA